MKGEFIMVYLNGNGANGKPRCVSGASISQLVRHMSPVERAILGAELVEGRVTLEPPTAKTVGGLVGVSQNYVFAALRLTPAQRDAVLAGDRPLIQPQRCLSAPIGWTELVEELRLIGTDKTLEAAVEAEHSNVA
jgi:hypothetical protein